VLSKKQMGLTASIKSAAANSHRPFSFDRAMKFEYHFALLSTPPVAVAELGR
jgi:hypothetical protein